MKKIIQFSMIMVLVMSFCACKSSKSNKNSGNFPLVNTQWNLDAINGDVISHDFAIRPFITFDSTGVISGSLGCNSFFGEYTVVGKQKINVEYKGSTKRLCQKMEVEKAFMNALKNDINNYQIRGDELFLYNGKTEVLRFTGVDLKSVE